MIDTKSGRTARFGVAAIVAAIGFAAALSGILFVINAALAVITFWSSKFWVNYHIE